MTQTQRAPAATEHQLEEHRRELTGYCYRMLGSAFDAEDAVQDTMVRAWRAIDRFDGRSSLRSWLYRIATNVCFDMLGSKKRRAFPVDMSPSASPPVHTSLGPQLTEGSWVEPIDDGRVAPETTDPAEIAESRESIRLAFVAALQHLPAKQRAVLILRDVLRWKADEVAQLLDASVASVNSALQRARATLAGNDVTEGRPADPIDDEQRALLERYVKAFEAYDIEALVALLHEDAVQSMPPYAMWLSGAEDIGTWMLGVGSGCRGSRLIPLEVNGSLGFAQYRPGGPGGRHEPWGIHVLRISDRRVAEITTFLDAKLFAFFGLPATL
ncbi:MAG: sigma-70 family RNA polymerase sigma factor [Sporichthyaceae bacterium]